MTEFEFQKELVNYLELLIASGRDIKFSAIPNSTYTTSWSVKTKNKQSGVRPGLPDLFLIINNKPLFIELKTPKGRISEYQKEWIAKINECNGITAYVIRDLDEALDVIHAYL